MVKGENTFRPLYTGRPTSEASTSASIDFRHGLYIFFLLVRTSSFDLGNKIIRETIPLKEASHEKMTSNFMRSM